MLPTPQRPYVQTATERLDPVEVYLPLAFKAGVYALLTVYFVQAIDAFASYQPGHNWGFLLWITRMFTFLPLHEGGHFLFRFFGQTLYVLGGSFWQITFPLLWFVIAVRQRSQVFPFALFWVGENMMDVSLYIRDAPARMLPLLGGDKSGHDWHYLLSRWDMMDDAGAFADIMFYGGAAICIGAIATGITWAVMVFIRSLRPVPVIPPAKVDTRTPLEDALDDQLKREGGA